MSNFKKREKCLDLMDRLLKINEKSLDNTIKSINEPIFNPITIVLAIIAFTTIMLFIFIL